MTEHKTITLEELIETYNDDKNGEYIAVNDDNEAFHVAHGSTIEQIEPVDGSIWKGIEKWKKDNCFFPNVWSINERGNVTLRSDTGKNLGGLV